MESAYEDLGPTPRLISPDAEQPSRPRRVPGAIQRLIGELGLRYRPSAQTDLEAHAAAIALLASDLADVPPVYLERAIRKWVLTSHFMPRASELANLAQEFLSATRPSSEKPADIAEKRNAMLRASLAISNKPLRIHWYVEDGEVLMESVDDWYKRESN
jgi:hypothetical protein